MTELEKMLAGKLYDISDKEIEEKRLRAHRLCQDYNRTYEDEVDKRNKILDELLPNRGSGTGFMGPIYFDYGIYTKFGKNCYVNFNFTVLDCSPITIGNNVFFGPNCTLAAPLHPLLPEERMLRVKEDGTYYDLEYSKPIVIEDDCWIASNVVILGGVKIGKGSVIGAGSVVTKDIPVGVLAVGNPCRVVRKITSEDSVMLKSDLF